MAELEMLRVEALRPYKRNSRTHSEKQVEQLAASIQKFGFNNPVLVNAAGEIVAGHGRVAAARKLGLAEVPCLRLHHLSEVEARAYVIADNQLAINAGWDADMLSAELADLAAIDFDMGLLGFSGDELKAHMAGAGTAGLTDPDLAPPAPVEPVSRLGDVWLLGRHRLVCGDGTDSKDVGKALNGVVPHLMVTDPPYGVQYDPKWRARAGVNRNTKKLGEVLNDDRADWREAWELFPGDVAYVWHASLFTREVLNSLEACGFKHRSMIIWAKDRFTLGRGDYHWQHEPAWYVVRDGKAGQYVGGRSQSTVWNISARDDSGFGHGTQKPIECMKRPIENNSRPGDSVYEPFSGSGTTIIACEMTGRTCHAIELSPAYVDVAVKRWQAFTGLKASRESDGAEFPD